jgi:hypothetical protein
MVGSFIKVLDFDTLSVYIFAAIRQTDRLSPLLNDRRHITKPKDASCA